MLEYGLSFCRHYMPMHFLFWTCANSGWPNTCKSTVGFGVFIAQLRLQLTMKWEPTLYLIRVLDMESDVRF